MVDPKIANDSTSINTEVVPDAIHIGFSKCGSTFLQSILRQHSEIYLTHKLHFFSPFGFDNFGKGKQFYGEAFKYAKSKTKVDSDEHIILPIYHPVLGSAATTLESVLTVTQRMKSIAPSTKIILVIRNQTSLLLSRYSEYLLGGGKVNFKTFVEENLSCSLDHKNYYENFYFKIIKILRDNFSSTNVLVLLQEEFLNNRNAVIETICKFLNVRTEYPPKTKLRDKRIGLSVYGMKMMRLLNFLVVIKPETFNSIAQTRGPYLIYKFFQRSIRLFDYYLIKTIPMDRSKVFTKGLKAKIQKIFQEDNSQLSVLLNKDLKKLGYIQ